MSLAGALLLLVARTKTNFDAFFVFLALMLLGGSHGI